MYKRQELKHGYEELGVRAVPHAVARYGAYIAPGAILMPSYVNILSLIHIFAGGRAAS